MRYGSLNLRRLGLAAFATVLAWAAICASALADDHVTWMEGAQPKGTPTDLNQVGVLKIGPSSAPNVLVLVPGTSAGAGYFAPLARTLVKNVPGWQVWSVERRENQLEDQSVFNQAKRGHASPQKVFNYYLRWTTDHNITDHVQLIPDSEVGFARGWGMRVEVNDLRHVVKAAARNGRNVVLGGHSLGGSITTAYATWDFNGEAGVDDLSGLVYIDGGSSPDPVTPGEARQSMSDLQKSSPWLAFGGIPAPFAGLFGDGGASSTKMDPNGPSLAENWSGLPSYLKPPVPVTNEAQFGYAADSQTSPSSLAAFQVHAGRLAGSGDPRRWVRAGEITPLQRYATMIGGWGLRSTDGTAWYHPMRLTIDSGAVGDGNANPAQQVLDVRATHGDDIDVPIYAFGAALGDGRVLDAARALAQQSGLPQRDLTLIDRSNTYSHNDPSAAFPDNAFVDHLVPFLKGVEQP